MKIDIICCYYRQIQYLPFFAWGIEQNKDEIERVIIVNDEPWDDDEIVKIMDTLPVPVTLLDHDHAGEGTHGVARCFNQGLSRATTDYAFLTSFDQILTPGTLLDILDLASPSRMVLGRVDSISSSTKLEDLPDPTIIRKDMYDSHILKLRANPGMVCIGSWRNGHTLVDVDAHFEIGGFDERFVRWGYGLEDQDYAIRWLLEFGRHSIVWGDSSSWHFAGDKPSATDPKKAEWNPEAVKIVNDNLNRLYTKHNIIPLERCYYQHKKGEEYA